MKLLLFTEKQTGWLRNMTQTREDLIQSIADELRSGHLVRSADQNHDIENVHEFICGHDTYCDRLSQINIRASLNPQDAQGTQYKLDKLFDEAAYEYAERLADDVVAYRYCQAWDELEGDYYE